MGDTSSGLGPEGKRICCLALSICNERRDSLFQELSQGEVMENYVLLEILDSLMVSCKNCSALYLVLQLNPDSPA